MKKPESQEHIEMRDEGQGPTQQQGTGSGAAWLLNVQQQRNSWQPQTGLLQGIELHARRAKRYCIPFSIPSRLIALNSCLMISS